MLGPWCGYTAMKEMYSDCTESIIVRNHLQLGWISESGERVVGYGSEKDMDWGLFKQSRSLGPWEQLTIKHHGFLLWFFLGGGVEGMTKFLSFEDKENWLMRYRD